jgi:hypothetical protein
VTHDPADDPPPPGRPRKLTLRVSGSRVGSMTRPVADGATRIAPGRRFGLRVHGSALVRSIDPAALVPPAGGDDEDR